MSRGGSVAPAVTPSCSSLRAALALARALPLYWLVVFPRARRELRRWERLARSIPDPVLRAQALGKLDSERMLAEGAAAFGVLTARGHRADVIRACVAYEVMYDLLDALGESPADDVLADNRCLHRSLSAAVTPGLALEDYYAKHERRDDGGYLRELVETCRHAVARLPAHPAIVPAMGRFAARAAEAQSRNHAGIGQSPAAAAAGSQDDVRWWELAAASSDPLGIFALLAAGSHRETTARQVAALERAYFPWVGALTWLLESLVDAEDDATTGNHSYVAHYASRQHAAERLATIARHALAETWALPYAARHVVLLTGVVSLYLTHPGAEGPGARDVAAAVRDAFGAGVAPLLAVLRLRRATGG